MKKDSELSRMFQYAGNRHWLTIAGMVLAGISTILSMVPFVCIWFVVRDMIYALGKGDISLASHSSVYAWWAAGIAVLSILLYFAALCLAHLAAFRTATNMKKAAMHHIVDLPLGYFDRNTSGKLRRVIDDNAGLTENFLAHQLPDLAGAVVMPVAVFVLLFVFDWRLGLCCLVPLVLCVFFLKMMMGGDNAGFMEGYMTALETMNQEAVEYIRGIPVVKVFGQTVYSFKNFHAAIDDYEKYASGYALKCRIPMTGFQVALNSAFVLLIPVAGMLLGGATGAASWQEVFLDFLFYSLFTPVCATMMNRIMFAGEQLQAAKSAVTRIEAVIHEPVLPQEEQQEKPEDASVCFDRVSFAYPGEDKEALHDISFEIPAGKMVAFVGASGGGKSTAAKLIPRFYDVTQGSIRVGGVDVRKMGRTDLMDQIAFVFQNTTLFQDTLLENIRAARPDATMEEVMNAVKLAQCSEIVERLPKGLNTVVGHGGTYLSGGETQRIALARAILKDAPIVILDEATAFADARNERKIQDAFEHLAHKKTVVMIAHRLSTVCHADLILVFDHGEIIERGTHEELLQAGGRYASMWSDYQTSIQWKVQREADK